MIANVYIGWKINLIQQVRLVHALAESEYDIFLNESELGKFSELEKKFGIKLSAAKTGEFDVSGGLTISHKEPITRIGRIECPLIFPRGVADECRRMWSHQRNVRVGFCGLISPSRAKLISNWIDSNVEGEGWHFPDPNSLFGKLREKIGARLGLSKGLKKEIGPLLLWSSTRGRRFPGKAWDQGYFKCLADTEFTLCPSGDCVWSYRFFEAIFCGSIPIVEEKCDSYDGFRFHHFSDPLSTLEWSEDVALYNFQLCLDRLTVDRDLLNEAISRIIDDKQI